MKITEINCETGEVITREPNEEEIEQAKKDAENYKKNIALLQAKENAKNELLERLGITQEEAKLLLG